MEIVMFAAHDELRTFPAHAGLSSENPATLMERRYSGISAFQRVGSGVKVRTNEDRRLLAEPTALVYIPRCGVA